jgi:hypothetical protein
MNDIPKSIHSMINNNHLTKYGITVKVYTPSQVQKYIRQYKKFIVVRNPMSRLLSAYYDKIRPRKKFRVRLLGATPGKHVKPLTVDEFSTLVLDSDDVSFISNKHWNNYFMRSNPCYIDYDYILKVEALDRDLAKIFPAIYPGFNSNKYINVHENIKRPGISDNNSDIGTASVLGEYKDVNKTVIKRLMFHYEMESMFWGYSFDVEHSIAFCGYPGNYCC